MIIQQIAFIVALLAVGFVFMRRLRTIRSNILMGRPEKLTDQKGTRWKNMILFALGQKKMFRRPVPAFLHLLIYVGFIIINIEMLEIVLDGVLGTHRIMLPWLGAAYPALISAFEVLALLVLVSCLAFLIRRNIMKIKRFHSAEMKSWPKTDANLILVWESVLMLAFLTMNAADVALQQHGTAHYTAFDTPIISSIWASALFSLDASALQLVERSAWWLHILGVMAFAVYITHSKHLHVFLAFPNTWYARLRQPGHMDNMPAITNEVKLMLNPSAEVTPLEGEPGSFGAKDVKDLSWKSLMDAYACTECGRCTSVCPANVTGKKLSPRKVMMDTRDRLEEVGRAGTEMPQEVAERTLLHHYITPEELNACTSCQACVQECPVNIDPLTIILDLRRFLVMEESTAPQEWNLMFSNLENNFAPWQFSPDDRMKWMEE